VEVVLEIEEDPTRRIRFKSVSGIMNMRGAWQVFARANEIRLEYSASMGTGLWVPPHWRRHRSPECEAQA
jgi:hypothetical protein